MNGKTPKQERGYMLLVAIVLATIMGVMLAITMQPLNSASQRMKEREMIYRAEHLAQGIQRFYKKRGRFPFRLEELEDAQPRFVRRLYKDPMTEDGEWTLVYLNPIDLGAVKSLNRATSRLLGVEKETELNSENEGEKKPGLSSSAVFRIKNQQITGIRSRSDAVGFKERDDSSIYSDWLFSALPKNQVGVDDLKDLVNTKIPKGNKP